MRDLAKGRSRVIAMAKGYKTAGRAPVDVFVGKYSVVNLTLVPEVEPKPEPPPIERLVFQGTVYEQAGATRERQPLPWASALNRLMLISFSLD